MQNRETWRFVAWVAAAALVSAVPATAGSRERERKQDRDHRNYHKCESCGSQIETPGPQACGDDTCITYRITGGSAPDHFGVLLPLELVVVPGAYEVVDVCRRADPVLRVGNNCHDQLVRFNNAEARLAFTLRVAGTHGALPTTVIARKGNAVCPNGLLGVGPSTPAPPPELASCVNSCGRFDPHQSLKRVETFDFKGCQMRFEYNSDGSVGNFSACELVEGQCLGESERCAFTEGAIGELFLGSNFIGEGNSQGAFGDGWFNTGENSCSTRLIGGRYYTVCY